MTIPAITVALLLLATPRADAVLDQAPAAAAQAAVTVPDTPTGRALSGFVSSFNAGGAERQSWLKESTTLDAEDAASIYEQDVEVLREHGAMTAVRLPAASQTPTTIVAIVRHATTGVHGHLTIEVQAEGPYKVTNMTLRGATPEEIDGR